MGFFRAAISGRRVRFTDMRRVLGLSACLLFSACELNRAAPEDYTEVKRPGIPDDGNGTGLPRYEKERAACVDRINAFRATEGIAPLQRWTAEEDCVDLQAKSDSETGQAHGAFGNCHENAQDECPGWNSVQSTVDGCLQSMWDERLDPTGQQGHYRNMSNTRATQVACGFYETPDGKVWAVQNFR
jgi:hypothetical protein